MRPTTWRTSTHLIVGVGVLAIVAALVAAAALLTGSGRGVGGPKVPPPPQAVTAKPGVVPVADSAATPTKSGLAAALAAVVADPNLGKLGGRVTDAMTGEELWSQFDDLLLQPASTNKTLTSAAALLALDRNARVTTRVVAADQPGTRSHRAGGRRRPDPVGSGAGAGHLVPRRGSAQRSGRSGPSHLKSVVHHHPGHIFYRVLWEQRDLGHLPPQGTELSAQNSLALPLAFFRKRQRQVAHAHPLQTGMQRINSVGQSNSRRPCQRTRQ